MKSIKTRLIGAAVSVSAMLALTPAVAGVMQGSVAEEHVTELTNQIHWCTDLPEAEAAAKEKHKMILWVNMIGHMEGAT